MPQKINDISGRKFGTLTVTSQHKMRPSGKYRTKAYWKCFCKCGNEKFIQRTSLISGNSHSCGCLTKEMQSRARRLEPVLAAKRRIFGQYKIRAKKKSLVFDIDFNDFIKITQKTCHYCGSKPSNCYITVCTNGEFIYNGIDRVNNLLGYTLENCVPSCKTCNRAKDILGKKEFLQWIEKAYFYSVL